VYQWTLIQQKIKKLIGTAPMKFTAQNNKNYADYVVCPCRAVIRPAPIRVWTAGLGMAIFCRSRSSVALGAVGKLRSAWKHFNARGSPPVLAVSAMMHLRVWSDAVTRSIAMRCTTLSNWVCVLHAPSNADKKKMNREWVANVTRG